jgi:hypothetical protein
VLAEQFAEEHERDRITLDLARPDAVHPLHWSEMPVREVQVYRRRRWGWNHYRSGEKPRAGHLVREMPGFAAAGGAPRGTGARTIA